MKQKLTLYVMLVLLGICMLKVNVEAADYTDWSAVFDPVYYAQNYQDAANYSGGDNAKLFEYFLKVGVMRHDQASDEFNVDIYMSNYPALVNQYGSDIRSYYVHYQLKGKALGYNGKTRIEQQANENNSNTTASVTNEQLSKVTDAQIKKFFSKSVFVGDSIMVGYRNYALGTPASYAHNSQFLAVVGYSLTHAMNSASRGGIQPTYQGKRMNVWEAMKYMDVENVFIMFGTNDLTYTRADVFCEKYVPFIKKIREVNPDINVYIIGMTPVAAGVSKGALNAGGVRFVNEYLTAKQAEWGYTYVNLYSKVTDANGNILPKYCSDNYVHHNARCYQEVWESTLADVARMAIATSDK